MKKLFALIILGGLMLPCASRAIDFKQAKFTQVVNSVEVITPDQARHSAVVNDIFKIPDVLRTGPSSRAEMVAEDNTITRVGANTVFSFDPASRTIDLQQGSLLFHSPHGKGGGTIHTGSATASVLGTTIIVTTTPNGGFKVLVLEGEAEVRFINGLHATLTPGQMTFILPGGGTSPIVVFRLDKETSGSLLVNGFKDPLPSWNKIGTEITRQLLLLLNNKLQDTGLVVGNNATPNTVQVRMDILNGQQSPFATDASIIGTDHSPNQTAPVNYPPLDTAHVESSPFTPPVLNSDPTLDSFYQGLLFLGIVNPVTGGSPASGFVGNNVDIDTANVDLSSFASEPDFDIMAVNNLRIWQSVNFTPSFIGGGGSGGVITITALSLGSSQPNTISLFAGGQMLIAPNSTLEADTGTFGLVAGSFGVLDTTTGLADAGYPNTLLNVSLINQVGDVDVLSLSDLTIEGMNSAYTVQAVGEVNIQSDGTLTLGAIPSISALDNGHNVAIEADGSVNLTAQNDLSLYDAEVVANGGNIGFGGNVVLNSIAGSINVQDASSLNATGMLSLDAPGNVNLNNSNLQAGNAGNADVYAGGDIGIYYSTIGAGGNVNIQADGTLTMGTNPQYYDVSITAGGGATLSAGGNAIIADTYINAGGDVDFSSGGTISTPVGSFESEGSIGLGNSKIYAGDNGSFGQASTTGGAVNLNALNGNVNLSDDDIYAYDGSSTTSGNVNINAGGYVDVENSDIRQDGLVSAIAGSYVNLYNVFNDAYDGNSADTHLSDWNITGGSYVDIGADGLVQIYNSSIQADGGNVDITSGGPIALATTSAVSGGDMDIANSYIQAADSVNVTAKAGSVGIYDGSTLYAENGNVNISAPSLPGTGNPAYPGGAVDIESSYIYAGGDVKIESGGALTIGITSGNTIYAKGGLYLISDSSDAIMHNYEFDAGGGNGVNVSAFGGIDMENDSGVRAYNGSVTLNARGNNYLYSDNFYADNGNVILNSSSGSVNIEGSQLNASGNVNLGSFGNLDLISIDSVSSGIYAGGSVNLTTYYGNVDVEGSNIKAASGNIAISAGGAALLNNTTISASGSGGTAGNVVVNAGNGITVSGASISGDSAAGTIALNSTSGQTTIENGSSAQAFYLNVNSPDGILIDGASGGSLKGNTMNLTAGMGDASGGPTITVQNESLGNLTIVNVQSHTVNLDNDNLSSLSPYNFTSFYGGYYIDDGHQAGYVNFNNDTVDYNPIVNLDTPGTLDPNNNAGIGLVTSPSSSPGIHVLSASVPGVVSSVSLSAPSPANAIAANLSGSNPGFRAIGH